jgi:hypothetical protein
VGSVALHVLRSDLAGDSGSGANTLLGDTVGANMEAAGIMTHLWIDPLMGQGLGIMGGTRATQVAGDACQRSDRSLPGPRARLALRARTELTAAAHAAAFN